ncbi:MAG: flagellar protein [Lachnospiraceae bacterium]|nr:flagellar protein [Lachnospiraceae bacterium]
MNEIGSNFGSIQQIADTYLSNQTSKSRESSTVTNSFEDVLRQRISEESKVKFSKHAAARLDERNISLSEEQNVRLEAGIMKAGEKGINDSLVIMDSLAFIVNVPNQTVVTALDQDESNGNVFTNIDGAVIA